ncbi:MAG: sigma-70 family RNA polymerase sigma factor [Alphaproteobacteria bacterium]|jgi:RNA polymerase sigma-70 factor (ECF subfamily)|nr:sigma-70 family RNA polymerase sigma factor [Alphaproteobacteria bacterium]
MTYTVDDTAFKQELSGLIPHLRAFARSLCGDPALADDLAQDAMLKAWKARASFQPGTNMKAWTFTILRNLFYSEKRRSWRRQPLDPDVAEATLVSNDDASDTVELLALRNALARLPDDQREAVILVGAGGMAYEDVADICDCAVGTIKSRVSRARTALAELLNDTAGGFSSEDGLHADEAFDDLMEQVADLSKPAQ